MAKGQKLSRNTSHVTYTLELWCVVSQVTEGAAPSLKKLESFKASSPHRKAQLAPKARSQTLKQGPCVPFPNSHDSWPFHEVSRKHHMKKKIANFPNTLGPLQPPCRPPPLRPKSPKSP